MNAIYQLTIRQVGNFDDAMEARLAAIPAHLTAAQLRFSARARYIPAVWARAATQSARGGVGFLRALAGHPKIVASVKRDALTAHLEKAARERDILERLYGRQRTAHRFHIAKQEQKWVDEIAQQIKRGLLSAI